MIGNCWKVDRWSRNPLPIEIKRETDKCYFFMCSGWKGAPEERRELKRGNNIFGSWEDAKAYMIAEAEKSLEYAKQEVDRKRSALEVVKAMKP
jgi:hypothetical protein